MSLPDAGTHSPSNSAEQTRNAGQQDRVCRTTLQYRGGEYTLHVFEKQCLGEGGFGLVLKGEMIDSAGKSSAVAVKIVSGLVGDNQTLFKKEVERWNGLVHVNVQEFYGVSGRTGILQFGMVSPLAANGNMEQFINKNPAINKLPLLVQVAAGLKYLHIGAKIVHGDLKCRNVLISADGCPKISDFGLSTVVVKGETITKTLFRLLRTVAFAAPELFTDSAFQSSEESTTNQPAEKQVKKLRSKTMESDAFAFGGMIYETYAVNHPWHEYADMNVFDMAEKIRHEVIHRNRPQRPETPPNADPLSDAVWDFCNKCWAHEPSDRPNCNEILRRLKAVHWADQGGFFGLFERLWLSFYHVNK